MKLVRIIGRLLLGTVFIFSGFVKAIDPLGSAYKLSDYFSVFRLGFLDRLSTPLSILLSCFELILGITLILGYRRRVLYEVLFWFVSFFTLLTFILALFNPVTDCGCFGDALVLTNWETFLKNLVLMVFVVPLYLIRKREAGTGFPLMEWSAVGTLFILAVLFSVWNLRHLPMIDFRPYDVGTVIPDEMVIPDGAPVDKYETTLIYRNKTSGKKEDFTLETYPKDTVNWEFVNSESRLVSKGYEPPIHDFSVMDPSGEDVADQILTDDGYTLLMVSHDLGHANRDMLLKAGDWSRLELLAEDFSFLAITSSPSGEVESVSSNMDLDYSFYAADEIMLKTMVRSNPGFMLLKNGVILAKWGFRDLPALQELIPNWDELIGSALEPLDEEAQMLREEGVYEDFSFDVIRFEDLVPPLYLKEDSMKRERGAKLGFLFAVFLALLLCQYVSPTKG